MTFTAPRAALAEVLGHFDRIVERRNTIPILSNLRISAAPGALKLMATDLDIIAESLLADGITCDQPVETTVPAGLLKDIVKRLDGDVVTFTPDTADRMRLTCGRSRFSLPTLPADDFPMSRIDTLPQAVAITLPAEAWRKGFDAVSFAMSTEETRYYLNGVYLHDIEDSIAFVATDGHRLSKWLVPPEAFPASPGTLSAIIPAKTVNLLLALLPKSGDCTIEINDKALLCQMPGLTLRSKLVDGTFPDYGRVIPRANPITLTLDAAATIAAIERVATISSERGRAVKLVVGEATLRLEVVHPDIGSAVEEIAATSDVDGTLEVGFNSKYLAEVLSSIGSARITAHLADPGSPMLLTAADRPQEVVVMPMRV
jgi:DNA polymerase-3 subunit beta